MNESNNFVKTDLSSDCIEALLDIKKKFFCCRSDTTAEDFLKCALWDDQKYLLDSTVISTLNIKYPVKRCFQIAFLKKFIASLEEENHEVHDNIYEELCRLQVLPKEDSEHIFKHYFLSKQNVIFSMRESKSFVLNGTTGLCTWQASLALSNWILENPEYIRGNSVLELGSGTGLLGFIASKCCQASEVVLTDGSPEVMKLLNENLTRNFEDAELVVNDGDYKFFEYYNRNIGTYLLPWQEVQTSKIEEIIRPDVILAADVVYDNSIFIPLADALDYIFEKAKNDCSLLLASTRRNEKTLHEFYDILEERNFVLHKRKKCNPKDRELCCDDALVEIVYVYKNKL